ncbi:hypothetical protein [Acinetobacter sp. MB5]|uniref:hypothetical protein n=1 Tax=Acinetobacter sp. MB5 TaxID=2069438 RepID=UPI0013A6D980|nr:hypothetical protein [Acinetobacter sp. MB5]
MKFKIITHRVYRIEREIEAESQEEAMQYAEALQQADLPEDAVRSDDLGVQEITES